MKDHDFHSPAFTGRPVCCRPCDWPGCSESADFRAPKSRAELNAYYWFCLDHVRRYNARWDYLAGLSEQEIEAVIRAATVWERPTKKRTESWRDENILFDMLRDQDPPGPKAKARPAEAPFSVGEEEALAVLGLARPVVFVDIKTRYHLLAKRHHPDRNGGKGEALEKIKTINRAFAILRKIYGPVKEQKDKK